MVQYCVFNGSISVPKYVITYIYQKKLMKVESQNCEPIRMISSPNFEGLS
jgi:hypothetical protein